jgi:Tc5 transposase DNA-binding domain
MSTSLEATALSIGRVKGGKSRAEAHESQKLLHNYEEKSLVVWITMMAATGNPVSQACVTEMADEIRKRRLIGVNDESMNLVEYPPIGKCWVKRFLKRYPSLQTILSRSIEAARIKEVSPQLVSQFFEVFKQVLKELNIEWQDVYNMDETGNYYYISLFLC